MGTHNTLHRVVRLSILFLIAFLFLASAIPGYAQDESEIQVLEGRVEVGEVMYYRLPDLKAGDTLYAYMRNLSGNLNPLLTLSDILANTWPATASLPLIPMRKPSTAMLAGVQFGSRLINTGLSNR